MAMHTLTFHCVGNIPATGIHSCREGESVLWLPWLWVHMVKVWVVTVPCLMGQFCVIALKHHCHAMLAPSCTTGRAEGAPKKPSLRRTCHWHHPSTVLLFITHLPYLSPLHLWCEPSQMSQILTCVHKSGAHCWHKVISLRETLKINLDCFIPGISNISGLILVSHPTIQRAGLEIVDPLPFRQRGAPPVGKDLLKGENYAIPSFPPKAMTYTACIPFYSFLPAWIFVLILTKCMELQQNSPRHRDKRKSIMFLTLPEAKCLTYRRSITTTCQISHPVLVVTWICGMP